MVKLIQKALTQYAKDAKVEGLNPNAISLDGIYPLEGCGGANGYTSLSLRIEGHLTIDVGFGHEMHVLFNRVYDVAADGGVALCQADFGEAHNEAIYGAK